MKKKVSLKQFEKSINLKGLINFIDSQILKKEDLFFLNFGLIESIVWECSDYDEYNEIITSDLRKMFKRRLSDFRSPIDIFDITSAHSNFEFVKEIDLENKFGKYFVKCFFSKINKYYYISIEEIPKHTFEPGDNIVYKSKIKLTTINTMDLIKKNLLKCKNIKEIKIGNLCYKK